MKRVLTLCALAIFGICNMGQKAGGTDPVEKAAPLDIAKASYANIGGKLYVYTGKTAIAKQYDSTQSKLVDVAVPKADTVKAEAPTDSTGIVWVGTAQYEVRIKRELKNGYRGTFDPRMGKAFWVGDIIGVDGKRRPSNAVIDYENGTYFVPGVLKAGEAVDPGYASASGLVGITINGTRPASSDTVGLVHSYPFNVDTGSGGITADSTGSVNGVFSGGAFDSIGAKYGSGCAVFPDGAGGDNMVKVPDVTIMDGLKSFTITGWMWMVDTATATKGILGSTSSATVYNLVAVSTKAFDVFIRDGGAAQYRATFPAMDGSAINQKWSHFAVSKQDTAASSANVIKAYLNGTRLGNPSISGTYFNSVANLDTMTLGNSKLAAYPFKGRLDNVKFYTVEKSQITINTSSIAGREMWRGPDTTTGTVLVDTAGARVDSLCFKRKGGTAAGDSIKYKVAADNLYNITSIFSLVSGDTTYEDSTSDTVDIAEGKQVIKRDTLRQKSLDAIQLYPWNNVGAGGTTEYSLQLNRATARIYAYDTIAVATTTDPSSGFTGGFIGGWIGRFKNGWK